MEIITAIRYKEAIANYKLKAEVPGVFQAELIHFDGAGADRPPQTITLVKGVRTWSGSSDDEVLLGQLGATVDALLQKTKSQI